MRDKVAEAKANNDLEALREVYETSPPYKKYRKAMDSQNLPPVNSTKVIADAPEMTGFVVTDGSYMVNEGQLRSTLTGTSCSALAHLMGEAQRMESTTSIVYRHRSDFQPERPPVIKFHISYVTFIGDGKTKGVAPTVVKFPITDTAQINNIHARSADIDKLRKAVQKLHPIKVSHRLRTGEQSDISKAAVVSLVRKHIRNAADKKTFLNLLTKRPGNETAKTKLAGILNGTVFTRVQAQISAFWAFWIMELGFGSSHWISVFQPDKFRAVLLECTNQRHYLSRFILSWAGFDGSIFYERYKAFVVIVPTDEKLKDMFRALFKYLFNVTPNEYTRPSLVGGKDICLLSVKKTREVQKICQQLAPFDSAWVPNKKRRELRLGNEAASTNDHVKDDWLAALIHSDQSFTDFWSPTAEPLAAAVSDDADDDELLAAVMAEANDRALQNEGIDTSFMV